MYGSSRGEPACDRGVDGHQVAGFHVRQNALPGCRDGHKMAPVVSLNTQRQVTAACFVLTLIVRAPQSSQRLRNSRLVGVASPPVLENPRKVRSTGFARGAPGEPTSPSDWLGAWRWL